MANKKSRGGKAKGKGKASAAKEEEEDVLKAAMELSAQEAEALRAARDKEREDFARAVAESLALCQEKASCVDAVPAARVGSITKEAELSDADKPVCNACKCSMDWTTYAEKAYAKGWVCSSADKCWGRREPAGTARWACLACNHDICGKCVPNNNAEGHQKAIVVADGQDTAKPKSKKALKRARQRERKKAKQQAERAGAGAMAAADTDAEEYGSEDSDFELAIAESLALYEKEAAKSSSTSTAANGALSRSSSSSSEAPVTEGNKALHPSSEAEAAQEGSVGKAEQAVVGAPETPLDGKFAQPTDVVLESASLKREVTDAVDRACAAEHYLIEAPGKVAAAEALKLADEESRSREPSHQFWRLGQHATAAASQADASTQTDATGSEEHREAQLAELAAKLVAAEEEIANLRQQLQRAHVAARGTVHNMQAATTKAQAIGEQADTFTNTKRESQNESSEERPILLGTTEMPLAASTELEKELTSSHRKEGKGRPGRKG